MWYWSLLIVRPHLHRNAAPLQCFLGRSIILRILESDLKSLTLIASYVYVSFTPIFPHLYQQRKRKLLTLSSLSFTYLTARHGALPSKNTPGCHCPSAITFLLTSAVRSRSCFPQYSFISLSTITLTHSLYVKVLITMVCTLYTTFILTSSASGAGPNPADSGPTPRCCCPSSRGTLSTKNS